MFDNDIEAVLFDWAGVLVSDGFRDISVYEYERGFGVPEGSLDRAKTIYWPALSLEKISEQEFWYNVFVKAGILPADNFIEMVRQTILDSHQPYKQVWSLVKTIKEGSSQIKVGILSNNCREWMKYWKQKYPLSIFDPIITSYEVGYRKPDRRMYKRAAEILGVDANKILFFDDQEGNIESARYVGLGAVLIQPGEML